MKQDRQHGGPRRNSGRKPLPEAERKVMMAKRVHPDIKAYLDAQDNATETLEQAVRNSKGFKEWKRQQGK